MQYFQTAYVLRCSEALKAYHNEETELPGHFDPQREKLLLENSRQDLAVFQEIYAFYLPKVYTYMSYRVGRVQDAEDLVSSVFLKVVEQLGKFQWRGEGSFTAWLFKIAHNQIVDHHRQHQNSQVVELENLPELTSSVLLPAEQILQKEKFEYLRSLISNLSPRKQEIVTLKFYGGLRNAEIAQVLELDERTVASHLCRALNDLHQMYVNEPSLLKKVEVCNER